MNHSPSGRVGLSGPERAELTMTRHSRTHLQLALLPSPAATASDPPEREGDIGFSYRASIPRLWRA